VSDARKFFLGLFSGAVLYVLVGMGTASLLARDTCPGDPQGLDKARFGGVLWPIALPIHLIQHSAVAANPGIKVCPKVTP
jgi:hypothetical protein